MRAFRSTLLIAILLLAFHQSTMKTQAQPSSWHIQSFQSLVNRDWAIQRAFPAPDGFHIGYEKEEHLFCSVNLLTDQEQCVSVPPEMGRLQVEDWFPSMSWSPTADRVAVTGVPYRFLRDTDLTVLSLELGKAYVLAQDNYEGDIFPPDEVADGTIIDLSPAWSPDGKTIAVERVTIAADTYPPATITLLDTLTGDAHELAKLPGYKADWTDMGSTLEIAWSPDGKTIAASFRHQEMNPEEDGIWLFDVSSGKSTQLLSIADAQQAYNEIVPEVDILVTSPISWSPDGSRLLFWAGDLGAYLSQPWCFWIDIATKEITPLPLPTHPSDVERLRMISPHSAAWSPDGSMLLVATRELSPLPGESTELLDPAAESDSEEIRGIRLIDIETGESVLLGHVPAGPFPLYKAVWGPDNNVIISGYYLKLVQQ